MRSTLFPVALGLVLAGSAAFAQQAPPAPAQPPAAPVTRGQDGPHYGHHPRGMHNPQREAAMMSRRLNLLPDQTSRLEPILADSQQKMAALHANTALSPEQKHEQMRALHQQEHAQIASVLTPEQQEQLKAMRHGHRFHGQQGGQPSAGL